MKRLIIAGFLVAFFLLGFLSSTAILYAQQQNSNLQQLSGNKAVEKNSPSDYIKTSQIDVENNKVVLEIKGASWSSFANTNSMDPVLDEDANAIEIVPVCQDLNAGDIVVYKSVVSNEFIVHRIYSINKDDKGPYFRTKGDNNPALDPEKVRCEAIKYQVIGILY